MPILRVKNENGEWVEIPALVGPAGPQGPSPERGVDYWTDEDKQKIVDDVLAALPTWTGGSY